MSVRSTSFTLGIWALILLMGIVPGYAYEAIEVEHGGSIEGTITLDGSVPEPKGFNLITFPDPAYCGRISNGRGWRLLRDFVVGHQGGLKDAIVLLEGVEAGKPFE
ncbi:MAG: carboxypeptidase regulatory-like domain-containing protein, partial [Nitrospirota bacterium]